MSEELGGAGVGPGSGWDQGVESEETGGEEVLSASPGR
jgi:hypothetical protein